jgi:hypothetical protein
MGRTALTGEVGRNTIPLTTKEFKRIVHKYFRLSNVYVYKFTHPDHVAIYIHIYFNGKLNVNITEEIKAYVPLGCTFVFQHIHLWEFIYGKKYGWFFSKKKRLREEDCKQERDRVIEEIEHDQNKSERGDESGRGSPQGKHNVRSEVNGQETDNSGGGDVGKDLQPGVQEGYGTGADT